MTAGNENPTFAIEYQLTFPSTGVCVKCSFLDSTTSVCVAVVYRRISQLGSGGLMNIESSHKFNRSGNSTYGCIEGFDMDQYQVGVVDGILLDQQSTTGTPEGNNSDYSEI